jgi:hypothetical protein
MKASPAPNGVCEGATLEAILTTAAVCVPPPPAWWGLKSLGGGFLT